MDTTREHKHHGHWPSVDVRATDSRVEMTWDTARFAMDVPGGLRGASVWPCLVDMPAADRRKPNRHMPDDRLVAEQVLVVGLLRANGVLLVAVSLTGQQLATCQLFLDSCICELLVHCTRVASPHEHVNTLQVVAATESATLFHSQLGCSW